ncbi:TetR/AcrR family transcriptional regulator [Massilia sp. SM-13]|uniref:TetR/AcrR family transcriptional regulator n=1 Tax=Pseudoduganella rhizocola TaxID=3382643 RepID=UPI0038B5C363
MAGTRQFNEEEALDSAMLLFWRRGYGATSMQDLAEATGVLRGSLYNAYGDKQSIFLLAFARYRRNFMAQVRDTLEQPTVAEALRAYLDLSIRAMTLPEEERSGTRGCMSTKIAVDETARDEAIRTALRGLLDELAGLLEARFAAAPEEVALPPAAAARLLVTATRGMVVVERVYQDEGRLRETAESLATLLLPK